MTQPERQAVEGICDLAVFRGRAAPADAVPDLFLEVPHGATRAHHFEALRDELAGPFPDDLEAYFFVNTDVGAPEVAERVAARVVAGDPRRTAVTLRCHVPRTFIDCNRRIDDAPRPTATEAGQMTPGVGSYVTDPGDLKVLHVRYRAYRTFAEGLYRRVCGAGGLGLMVHSYAPRSVDVPVDDRIVERLRAAYEPDVVGTWPLRAEVDLISRDPDGVRLAHEGLAAAVAAACDRAGLRHADSEAYTLHPSSLAHHFASRWPGRTLCVEVRRDLLVRAFTPFAEMDADPAKVDRLAGVLADAVLAVSGPLAAAGPPPEDPSPERGSARP